MEDTSHKTNAELRAEIDALKEAVATRSAKAERRTKVNLALISVASAAVGALASFGAALVTGVYSLQENRDSNQAVASLEQQQFSFELIQGALSETDQQEQIRRLTFLAQIGLLPTIDSDRLSLLASEGKEFLDSGGLSGVALPNYTPVAERPVGKVQIALNRSGICRPNLTEDASIGPATVACTATYLGGAFEQAYAMLWWQPDVLLAWIEQGPPPRDWRARFVSFGLSERESPTWVARLSSGRDDDLSLQAQ